MDEPNHRKHHTKSISQIGGISFGSIFLFLCFYIDIIPFWFVLGSSLSIILGVIDDRYNIKWYIKLIVQLILVVFLSYTFWGKITELTFYDYTILVNPIGMFIVFTIWFVGIFNAVNLVDGLDGLAGGLMVILCISVGFIFHGLFSQINLFLTLLIIVFLLFNQRPAKIFMGDAGSLFLGYFLAVLPLLYYDLGHPSSTLNVTPFTVLVSFLVADTTRVFFTRILANKSPMNADTIHFHHLILQNSGSYMVTLFVIFSVVTISGVFAVLSGHFNFNKIGMLFHLLFLFLFILTPPAPTYAKIISKVVKPVYRLQMNIVEEKLNWPRTILVIILLMILMAKMLFAINLSQNLIRWDLVIAIVLLSVFIYIVRKDNMVIPTVQLFFSLMILEFGWHNKLGLFTQLIILMLIIAIVIFTFQRIYGTMINQYSALDLIIFFVTIGAVILFYFGMPLNFWLFLALFANWFSMGFIFRRVFFNIPSIEN